MMLGGVPIRVAMPPRMVAKERGMRLSPGARPALRAVWMSTGMSRARAATLFMKAERSPPTAPMMAMWAPRRREESTSVWVISRTAPERTSPAETTSTRATTRVAGWPKPEKAVSVGTTPRTTPSMSAAKATRS